MTDEELDVYRELREKNHPGSITKDRAQLLKEEEAWLEECKDLIGRPPPKISAEEMDEMFGPDCDLESYVSEGKGSIDIEKTAEEKPELAAVLYSMIEVALEDEEPVCVVAMAWYEKHQTMEEDTVLDILSKPDERSGSGGSTGSGG